MIAMCSSPMSIVPESDKRSNSIFLGCFLQMRGLIDPKTEHGNVECCQCVKVDYYTIYRD